VGEEGRVWRDLSIGTPLPPYSSPRAFLNIVMGVMGIWRWRGGEAPDSLGARLYPTKWRQTSDVEEATARVYIQPNGGRQAGAHTHRNRTLTDTRIRAGKRDLVIDELCFNADEPPGSLVGCFLNVAPHRLRLLDDLLPAGAARCCRGVICV
jgi:hypothetical protein